ncbi:MULTISPECIES: DMT family transporter [Comamonadaceae]|jgi:drug/metabolite transporter (DMT)-like permease|uniref:DMT family transporter n=1 Tax=Comamonadaceae TaxID=80864 RepID=UPI000BCAA057|nr:MULTISPECIES: DMT family transporter [Comamonadaceae]OYY33079.1 MAG: EamA family transporter [Polaromonas sp. 35-63-35]OYZ17264.1 MAG: EamA family transporter [Polaromonas sp. 16-63-31]OYZ76516.1 MAG: EamA family transporter [Polaromonas sp. 24-63-21]OZA47631.1 MAG: EamA family transporter [Polaromonas sp. 17-63-33]OZA85710.1 MAG: EamA family transporter [Polaromonas sp. 39-63-25]
MPANLYALGAIALWASLASLGVSLRHVPPFLLTGVALLVGSLLALPFVLKDRRQWRIPASTLLLGVYGLFGFHFLLFIALRHAPPVEANLVNYLWPLFMVVLAPLFLRGVKLRAAHVLAALLGFAGAAVAILGARTGSAGGGWAWGYLPALGSAFIWASYSLLTQRVPAFPTAAIGLFGLVSGLLSLLCHWALEPSAALSGRDWTLIAVMGLGPLGASFFLWDKALKLGDARQIGILSYVTPLGSTALLMLVSGRALSWSIGLAAAMIIGAAVLGTRTK